MFQHQFRNELKNNITKTLCQLPSNIYATKSQNYERAFSVLPRKAKNQNENCIKLYCLEKQKIIETSKNETMLSNNEAKTGCVLYFIVSVSQT